MTTTTMTKSAFILSNDLRFAQSWIYVAQRLTREALFLHCTPGGLPLLLAAHVDRRISEAQDILSILADLLPSISRRMDAASASSDSARSATHARARRLARTGTL